MPHVSGEKCLIFKEYQMGHKYEALKHRIEAKKRDLQAKLETMKADTHAEAAKHKSDITTKLNELEMHVKNGWENLTESAAAKLNDWLK